MTAIIHPCIWRRRVFLLLTGLLVFRILYLLIVPVDLIHDEAYYWDWSRQLDWGYYSKPPGVAWLIALATGLGESSAFFVRLPAAVLSTAGLFFVFLLGERLYGPRAGFSAALLSAATPGNAALGLVMTIDAPLLLFWSAALYCLWRMLERQAGRVHWVMWTAAAVGMGLLCKQTMIAFPALAALFIWLSREDRAEWATPAFWLGALGGLMFLLPVVWWNSRHDWVMWTHTQKHFGGEPLAWIDRVVGCAEFLITQLGVVSPTTWLLVMSLLVAASRLGPRLGRPELFLLVFSGIPLVCVYALSLKQRVEPNWPAPFYVAAIVLAAGRTELVPFYKPRTLSRAVAVGVVSVTVTYCLPFAVTAFGLKGSKVDAVVRMWGWRELGEQVGSHLAAVPHPEQTLMIVTGGRAAASELAFYLPSQPRVYLWNVSGRVETQYDVWGLPENRTGWDALIISPREVLDADLASAFQNVESLGQVVVKISPRRRHAYHLWRGMHLEEWPTPPCHEGIDLPRPADLSWRPKQGAAQ